GAGGVEDSWRSGGLVDGAQGPGVDVSLPGDVHRRHGDVHGVAGGEGGGDVGDDAVAQFAGVVQAEDRHRGAPGVGGKGEQAFPGEAGLGVLPDGLGGVGLDAAAVVEGGEGVDVPGGVDQGGDPAVAVGD